MKTKDVVFYTLFAPAILWQRFANILADLIQLAGERIIKFSKWFYRWFAFPFQTSRGAMYIGFPLSVATWIALVTGLIFILK